MAGHSASKTAGHVPGEVGLWVFIGGDLVVFAVFFITFAVYWRLETAVFEASSALLDKRIGLLNTLLLLTSSWFVAQAVSAVRSGAGKRARSLLMCAIALGAGFVILKGFEYYAKIVAGITLNTNNFFINYYMFTAIHLLHVIIGLGALTFIVSRFQPDGTWKDGMALIEGGGAFWHLVDLLWLALFALLYLL